jgi:hypothetical protein
MLAGKIADNSNPERRHPKDQITVTFPVETTTENHTLKWEPKPMRWGSGELAMRPEATKPGKDSRAQPLDPVTYPLTFKGNTLVDVAPRDRHRLPALPMRG